MERTGWLPIMVIASLGAALSYATWARHNDRVVFAELRKNYDSLVREAQFPAAGDNVSDTDLRLLTADDTTRLSAMVAGRRTLVYIERKGCPSCDWFDAEMSRRSPSWKDSMLVISLTSNRDSIRGQVGVPRDDLRKVPGTPLFLIVDADGTILNSALGAKRMLGVMALHGVSAPSFAEMARVRVRDEAPMRVIP